MKKFRVPLYIAGFFLVVLGFNFLLSLYYFSSYRADVELAMNSFLNAEITNDYATTYTKLSASRKAHTPYDQYVEKVKLFQNSNEPKPEDCQITRTELSSVIGTKYIGPEAKVLVTCKMSDSQLLMSRYGLILENKEWKLN